MVNSSDIAILSNLQNAMFNSRYTLLNKQKNLESEKPEMRVYDVYVYFQKKQWVDPHNKAIKQATHVSSSESRYRPVRSIAWFPDGETSYDFLRHF